MSSSSHIQTIEIQWKCWKYFSSPLLHARRALLQSVWFTRLVASAVLTQSIHGWQSEIKKRVSSHPYIHSRISINCHTHQAMLTSNDNSGMQNSFTVWNFYLSTACRWSLLVYGSISLSAGWGPAVRGSASLSISFIASTPQIARLHSNASTCKHRTYTASSHRACRWLNLSNNYTRSLPRHRYARL